MPTLTIVKLQISANSFPCLRYCFIGPKVNVLIFYTAPQAFNEHIVNPSAFAIHADINASLFENVCEGLAGELGNL